VSSGTETNVQLNLLQGGVISGTVRGMDGQRAASRTVTAFRIAYDAGREVLAPVLSKATDDRGEYRLFWLPPGEYYLAVNGETRQPNLLLRTFYPNAPDARSARLIELEEGREFTGADFELQARRTLKISGRIADNVPDVAEPRPDAPVSIYVEPTEPDFLTDFTTAMFSNVSRAAGLFEIRDVPPGSYDLLTIIPGSRGTPVLARAHVNVGSEDLEGVTMTVTPAVDVHARISLDGSLLTGDSGPKSPVIQLWPRQIPAPPVVLTPDASGEHVAEGVLQDLYRIVLLDIPDGSYVFDIRRGNESVYDTGVPLDERAAQPIDVMLKSGALSIDGSVLDAAGKPVPSATVVLVPPVDRRQNASRFRTQRADANGRFQVDDIPPGEYKLFAWESVPNTAYMNAAFLSKYESLGLGVNLVSGGNLTFDVPIIPAARR
jgi:hypothetical protein